MKKQAVVGALLAFMLLPSLAACTSESALTIITAGPTTITETITTTSQTMSLTTTATTQSPAATVYIPDPTPSFEGTVLEIDGENVLIRVDKVKEGPLISGTVWTNKNALREHKGGNVWVVGMPINVLYTGEMTKSDPPWLKTVVMFCDCPYHLQTKELKTTVTSLTTTDLLRTATNKLTTTT